jgi:tetratricopeptide (TPR) repeat protein
MLTCRVRRACLAAAAVVAGATISGSILSASAQEPPRGAPAAGGAAAPSVAEGRKIRGVLAWRKAVWTSDGSTFATAARALEECRAAGGGDDDVTLLFLLGHCYTRLGDAKRADDALRRARELAPAFPGNWLGEALRMTADRPGFQESPGTREAIPLLDRYLVEVARYDRQAPFAAELEYLGWLERGLRYFAVDAFDRAIHDLTRAAEIVRAEGRPPATELVRILSECHKKVSELGPAEALIRDALRRDPGEPSHYHVLGMVAADQLQKEASRAWYERALARRLDYGEPRAKLAYLAWEAGDLYAMRCHLEAYEAHWKSRWAVEPQTRSANTASNIHAGYGKYWLARGDRLADAGDLDGARRMWANARDRYVQSLSENPGCIGALAGLIQVLPQLGAPDEEVQRWKRKLQEIRESKPGAPASYRDTFC